MPHPLLTNFTHVCNGQWQAFAGAGRVELENRSDGGSVLRCYSAGFPAAGTRGFSLARASSNRDGSLGLNVPDGTILWVKGSVGAEVEGMIETNSGDASEGAV